MSGGYSGKEERFAWRRYMDEAVAHLKECEECWEYVMAHKEGESRQKKL